MLLPDVVPESSPQSEVPKAQAAPVFRYDVFISYSSQDKEWVRRGLLPRLEKAGLKACIDYRDFTRGAPSISECERGVVESRKVLLVLTPAYIASGWTEIENIMTQTLDPANRGLRMLPLLKAPCQKPLRFGALTHIDFTEEADDDAQHTLGWRQLMVALGGKEEELADTVTPTPERGDWLLAHPYAMAPHFTGRKAERFMLSGWLASDAEHPLLVLRALGGFGKSALTWQWLLKDVDPKAWPRVVWWSFYEADASFESFLEETLTYLTGQEVDLTQVGGKHAVELLLKLLQKTGTLLVLDGFEREMKAFGGLGAAYQGDEESQEKQGRECMSPLAEMFLYNLALRPGFQSKVLLTTRLRPQVLEARGGSLLTGSHEVELKQMDAADALAFFQAMGIRGTRAEIETACFHYGYHPLSLRLLAGLIVADFQHPGDIAAARRLDVSGSLVQRQHHVLEASYDGLSVARRTLLGYIACLRSLVSYEVMQALAEGLAAAHGGDAPSAPAPSAASLDADLRDLMARGLLNHDPQTRLFDFHPIVRRYAYDRLAAPARSAAHTRLCDYFAAVPGVAKVTRLEDLLPVIELYHHTVRAGRLDEAFVLYRDRLTSPLYFQLGAYGLIIELLRALFLDKEMRVPRLEKESGQAWTLNELANAYAQSGQPRRAVPLYELANALNEKRGDKKGLAAGLGNVARQHGGIGALRAASACLRRSIGLSQEIHGPFLEAVGHKELARLLVFCGVYAEAETELALALEIDEKGNQVQQQGVTWAHRVHLGLLLRRTAVTSTSIPAGVHWGYSTSTSAFLAAAQRVLHLADETARTRHPYERDYVRAYWLLGAAQRVAGQPGEAEQHLGEALQRCRRINLVELEADILIDLARLRADTGDTEEAQRLAEDARTLAERAGYVLKEADAHLEVAKLALGRGERDVARMHAQQARTLATCDGPPDYTYKVAYDEAGEMLKQLMVES